MVLLNGGDKCKRTCAEQQILLATKKGVSSPPTSDDNFGYYIKLMHCNSQRVGREIEEYLSVYVAVPGFPT